METVIENNPNYLSEKNPHVRDACISFDEGPHIYTINGESNYDSVTTFIGEHFEKFDADKIIDRMMKGKNWTQSKYYGKTKDEIKELWKNNGSQSADLGTELHKDIEYFYNHCEVNNKSIEYKYFLKFNQANDHLTPYRTEWMIWDKTHRLAGSIDMIYELNGELVMFDWKRTKELEKYSKYNKSSKTECISHIPDTKFWKYALQQNIYKYILESNYDVKIKEMNLLVLHPTNNSYLTFKLPNLQKEVSDLFNERLNNMKANIT